MQQHDLKYNYVNVCLKQFNILQLLSSKKDIGNLLIPDLGRELFNKFTSELNAKIEQSTL